ncbi:MAG: hypothetical protein AAGI03_08020 [Pseudomonadota bacterium]
MTEHSTWPAIWKIIAAVLRAAVAGVLAWLFWEVSKTPDWQLFVFLAAAFAVGAVKQAITALVFLIRLILRQRKWARFRRQGTAPKADQLAMEADLKRRGLIK